MTRSPTWTPRSRTDLILWEEPSTFCVFTKDLTIDVNMDPVLKKSITTIIQDNWDSFCEQGVSRPMFDFELCIDTGDFRPVCYHQPLYRIHERKIIDKHILVLGAND